MCSSVKWFSLSVCLKGRCCFPADGVFTFTAVFILLLSKEKNIRLFSESRSLRSRSLTFLSDSEVGRGKDKMAALQVMRLIKRSDFMQISLKRLACTSFPSAFCFRFCTLYAKCKVPALSMFSLFMRQQQS